MGIAVDRPRRYSTPKHEIELSKDRDLSVSLEGCPRRRWLYWLALLVCFAVGGCREEPPKTTEQLYTDERQLPAVYLTAKTSKRIVAPIEKGVFVDKETGELAWPAKVCTNPSCPGRGAAGEPFLFVAPDLSLKANPDGTVGYDSAKEVEIDNYFGNCPKCLATRNLTAESNADRKKYSDFVQEYVLPETEKGRKDLAEQRQARQKALEERMKRKAGS
jgi:hypothetical protein